MNSQVERTFKKVICLGLPKTGTTTFGRCAVTLGYEKAPYDVELVRQVAAKDTSAVGPALARHDCFEDWPWPVVYRDAYKLEPEAAYILTVRKDANIWLESIRNHTARNPSAESKQLRTHLFGDSDPWGQGEKYKDFYESHNEQVASFFSDKADQFATVCWERGDGWEELCALLRLEVPANTAFPHANSKASRERVFYRAKKKIKQIARPLRTKLLLR